MPRHSVKIKATTYNIGRSEDDLIRKDFKLGLPSPESEDAQKKLKVQASERRDQQFPMMFNEAFKQGTDFVCLQEANREKTQQWLTSAGAQNHAYDVLFGGPHPECSAAIVYNAAKWTRCNSTLTFTTPEMPETDFEAVAELFVHAQKKTTVAVASAHMRGCEPDQWEDGALEGSVQFQKVAQALHDLGLGEALEILGADTNTSPLHPRTDTTAGAPQAFTRCDNRDDVPSNINIFEDGGTRRKIDHIYAGPKSSFKLKTQELVGHSSLTLEDGPSDHGPVTVNIEAKRKR